MTNENLSIKTPQRAREEEAIRVREAEEADAPRLAAEAAEAEKAESLDPTKFDPNWKRQHSTREENADWIAWKQRRQTEHDAEVAERGAWGPRDPHWAFATSGQ